MDDNSVYIIDLGADEKGRHQGFYKIIFTTFDEGSFTFQFAELSEDIYVEFTIPKNDLLNFNFFSFGNSGEIKSLEPDKSTWDLLFTQYSELLYDGENLIPYLVTGVQINRFNTEAVLDESTEFNDIILKSTLQYDFTPDIDRPGYLWKKYNFDEGTYDIYPEKIYIIKSQNGQFYKLRFIDFYSSEGEGGHPKFEYQRL